MQLSMTSPAWSIVHSSVDDPLPLVLGTEAVLGSMLCNLSAVLRIFEMK